MLMWVFTIQEWIYNSGPRMEHRELLAKPTELDYKDLIVSDFQENAELGQLLESVNTT